MTIESVKNDLFSQLSQRLTQSGVMFRMFARAKSIRSLEHKMQIKGEKYRNGAKIQDMIGIRIVLYFSEDLEAVEMFLAGSGLVDRSVDDLDTSTFRPQRLNLVKTLPEPLIAPFRAALPQDYAQYIDNTYEIQVRTVFSEGWHEVEHDFRYKCKDDWEGCDLYSRRLNGIIATLETAQWSMGSMFREMSYKNMQDGNYHAMLRNQFLLRFADDALSPQVNAYLATHPDVVQQVQHTDRMVFVLMLLNHTTAIPLTFDNVLFLTNRIDIMDEGIMQLESPEFKTLFAQFVSE